MRSEFHHQLELLTAELGQMCQGAATTIHRATTALLDVDAETAEGVLLDLRDLSETDALVQHRVLKLLALQAPVAGDLRAVVAALQIAANADRMGGLAGHVARTVRRRHPAAVLPDEVRPSFAAMGRVAVQLADAAAEVVVDGDAGRAERICDEDQAMNELHRGLFGMVMDPRWTHGAGTAVDIVLLGRFYERFADHAADIARRVVFRTTGSSLSHTGSPERWRGLTA